MRVKYDLDIAYKSGIRKSPRIQLENRGYKIIKQINETEFIVENKEINEKYITENNMKE